MNRYKTRLIISVIIFLLSFMTLCAMILSIEISWAVLPFISFIISSAYILWFYTSWGKKYSDDIKHINENEIFKTGWIIEDAQWKKFAQNVLDDYITKNKNESKKSIRSVSYWLFTIPFAVLSVTLIFFSFFSPLILWLLPITLFFLWIPNINILNLIIPSFQKLQLIKWNKLKNVGFALGKYGFMLGNDYFPILGNDYWIDSASVESKDSDIFLILKTNQLLRRPVLREIDYREFIIPAPPSQKENAQRIARSLTTSQLNRKEYSLFPVSVNVLTTWIGESLSNKEVQNFFASSKNRYETIKHTDLTYFIFPKDGVEFAFDKTNYLDTIFLKSNFYRSNSLPNGIQPNMARNEVIERLKQPVKSGGGGVFMGKTVPNFDIWVFEGYALHVQYNVKDSIDLITLMKPRAIKTA